MSSSSDLSQAVGFCSCNPFLKASRVVDLFGAGFWHLLRVSRPALFASLSLSLFSLLQSICFLERGSTLVVHPLSSSTICLSMTLYP